MKLNLSIFICLLISCTLSKEEESHNLIPKTEFVGVLKQLHLAESRFQLNKRRGMGSVKNYLTIQYDSILSTYKTNEEMFERTLYYYAEHPDELEEIYSTLLEELKEEIVNLP